MENNTNTLFTPAAVLQLLLEIEELEGADLGLYEDENGEVMISVNDNNYIISQEEYTDIEVEPEVLDEISISEDEGYDILDEVIEDDDELIEGGIIKNAVKSLMLGGMVRFAAKHLLK